VTSPITFAGLLRRGGALPSRRPSLEALEDRLAPAVLTVGTLADTGPTSLRQAITTANTTPGQDTIQFSVTGTITLESTLPTITDSLLVQGPGAGSLTIARDGATGTPNFRLLTIDAGVSVALSGLTLSNGNVIGPGGAISNAGDLDLSGCVLSNNTARGDNGLGAAFVGGGSLPPAPTGGAGGTANGLGGAVYTSGTLNVRDCTFEGNVAQGGNGGSNVSYGSGGGGGGLGAGGAVYVDGGAAATIDSSLFVSNTAQGGNGNSGGPGFGNSTRGGGGGGGGVGGRGGDVGQNGIAGQFGGGGGGGGGGAGGAQGGAGGFGGGGGGGGAGFPNSTIGGAGGFGAGAGGFAGGSGGGGGGSGGGAGLGGAVANEGGNLVVRNSTFSANFARGGNGGQVQPAGAGKGGDGGSGFGGGVFSDGATSLTNNTLTANQAIAGAGAAGYRGATVPPARTGAAGSGQGGGLYSRTGPLTVQNTIVAGNTAAANADVFGTIGAGGNNLIGGNPGLLPLADNGGPTRTHALAPGSPAIDAGDTAAAAGLSSDQRGAPFVRVFGAAVDIGAFEVQPPPMPTPTPTPTPPAASTVSGVVFQDYNANGVLDPGEPGVPFETVLITVNGFIRLTGDTDANGRYVIGGVPPGSYVLTLDPLFSNFRPGIDQFTGTLAQRTAVVPGQTTVNLGIVLIDSVVPPPQPKADFFSPHPNADADEAFVRGLYHAILGRDADAVGLQIYASRLRAATLTRAQVVDAIFDSDEHHGLEVDSFYHTFLRRDADPVGRAAWVAQLNNGVPEELVVVQFILSPEYAALHPDDFVSAVFSDVVGPFAQESASGAIATAAQTSRAGFVLGVVRSDEALRRAVSSFYAVYLHRGPDDAGLAGHLLALKSGPLNEADVARAFLASPEFFTDAAAAVP
jgi:hypothetical protein